MDGAARTIRLNADAVEIPAAAVRRYLGMGRTMPDEALNALIERSVAAFRGYVRYQASCALVAVEHTAGATLLGGLEAPGENLAKNLAGCGRAILFAATVGLETERRRRQAAVRSQAEGLVLDAVGTAAIEAFCDALCANWAAEFSPDKLRPRFSPGYGDLPLAFQKTLLARLDAARLVGITLTDALLMMPQKSVSAIVGIGAAGCAARTAACFDCEKSDCAFRL
ncbi:MAG: vitamin B12 dependent-methionine synthase activation domain-containing protein [Oscillospiraceae bacterium]